MGLQLKAKKVEQTADKSTFVARFVTELNRQNLLKAATNKVLKKGMPRIRLTSSLAAIRDLLICYPDAVGFQSPVLPALLAQIHLEFEFGI